MVTDLPDYSKKVIVVYEGTIVSGEVKVDHVKIKGLTLKDPYVALCIPSSIENPALAYEALTDRFKCKIEAWDIASIVADISDDWTRQLGQVDIARVLGAAMAHANPLYTRLTNGSAFIDPRDRNWTITEALARSWLLTASDIVTANAGTNLNTSALALETTLGTVHGHVDSIDGKITACNTGAVVLATGTASIGKLSQATLHDAQTFGSARIDTATITTNVEVVAAQGEGKIIYVIGYQLQGKGDVEAVLRSASTDLSPEWDLNAREGAIAPICVWPAYYFKTAANEALNIYLDAAIRVTGNVQYVVGA